MNLRRQERARNEGSTGLNVITPKLLPDNVIPSRNTSIYFQIASTIQPEIPDDLTRLRPEARGLSSRPNYYQIMSSRPNYYQIMSSRPRTVHLLPGSVQITTRYSCITSTPRPNYCQSMDVVSPFNTRRTARRFGAPPPGSMRPVITPKLLPDNGITSTLLPDDVSTFHITTG